jgi:hypothetical protein
MLGVAIVAVVLGGFDAVFIHPIRVHMRDFRRSEGLLRSLEDRRPPEVSPETWADLVLWTRNANSNCASFRGSIEPADFTAFLDELERKLRGPVNVETIDWIWDQYVRISRAGPSYDRFRPTRLEHGAKQVPPAGTGPKVNGGGSGEIP